MRKKQLIESILSEELKRFNQIGDYVNEQFMGLSSQNVSLMEQEPTEDEEEGGGDEDPLADLDLGGDEVTDDLGGEDTTDTTDTTDTADTGDTEDSSLETETSDNTEELEVTDIVNMTKETGEKTDELETTISKQSENLNSLIDKLDDLEAKLNNMDKIISAVDNLEDKFEKYRPQTPVEKLELRYLDSGPFNQSPKSYWEEKGEKLKQQKDKHEYVLNGEEVSDYSEGDIKNSWVYSPEEE
tara:strand:- start:3513 stop:4238 length:726 start_codon:yes stop_codon:yes gene_type:complete